MARSCVGAGRAENFLPVRLLWAYSRWDGLLRPYAFVCPCYNKVIIYLRGLYMGNLSISVNNQPLRNVELRQVKDDMSLKEAEAVLKAQKDGLDTIGITIEDVNYIITGKGIDARPGDTILIEGQAAGKIDFVEQEENTFGEGFEAGRKPVKGLEGLEQGIMAGMLPLQQGLVRGTIASVRGLTANDKAVEQVTQGPPIDKQLIEDMAKAMSTLFGGGGGW
jgi:hypothetical protein